MKPKILNLTLFLVISVHKNFHKAKNNLQFYFWEVIEMLVLMTAFKI